MYDELTEKDIEKIKKEIEYRKLEVRPKALEALKEARAQGDLSENFEYYAAKRANRSNNSRINYLERTIRTARIISDESKEDEVGLNNTVTVYFPDDEEEDTYKLVTTIRGNSLKNLISIDSPMGKALLGHKAGDTVDVEVSPGNSYQVVIRSIENTVDDDNDGIRQF